MLLFLPQQQLLMFVIILTPELLNLFIILMLKQAQQPQSDLQYVCQTRRQHFNHLRNTSTSMRGCLTWDPSTSMPIQPQQYPDYQPPRQLEAPNEEESLSRQRKNVSFDPKNNSETTVNKSKLNHLTITSQKTAPSQNTSLNTRERAKSAKPRRERGNQSNLDAQIRDRIRGRELQEEAQKKDQKRQKVQKYIADQMPYTRALTNTRYQDYFDKAALESYGRASVKNAAGGIIYGNHQKTFNVNPHIRGNQPKNYQTHYTAINYSKRTKLNDEDKWKRLQKQLCKKLGLKDKNQTLKEGKEVIFVDVDTSNMHTLMRQNLKFKKQHDHQIRNCEKDYKSQIEGEKQAAIDQFYAKKRDRIMSNGTVEGKQSAYECDRDQRGRLQEQVVYRMTDKNGNTRIGGDRHALTCFVDMNFPENSAAYTQELIDRMPIYPVQVEQKDKGIDEQRRVNYGNSLDNIYPSHYVMPNSDQPQIIKMISSKYGSPEEEPSQPLKQPMGSTFATTAANNSSLVPK